MTEDKVFVGTQSKFYCYDLSGERIWEFNTNGPVTPASCASNDLVLFLTNVNDSLSDAYSTLYCLDFQGALIWNYTLEPYNWALASPTLSNGKVFAASDNGRIYCLGSLEADGDSDNGSPWDSAAYLIMAIALIMVFILIMVGVVRSMRGR